MTDLTIPGMIAAAWAALTLCAACVPVAAPDAVRLDDVSAAAYQAGRTQQAAQTQDAGTAASAARADAWTVTSVSRTELAALVAATLQAGADQATARALTPTLTPIPTSTPAPTQTPRPTWTPTPDAVATQRAETLAASGYYATLALPWLLVVGLCVLMIIGILWVAGRLWANWERHMGQARRERFIHAPNAMYDTAREEWIPLLEAPRPQPEPRPMAPEPENAQAAWRHAWAVSAALMAGWLDLLPPEERQRDDMEAAGQISADGWNQLIPVLLRLGAIERHRKYYRLAGDWTPERVRTALELGAAGALPPWTPTAPERAPRVAPLPNYRTTVATVIPD